MFLMGEEVGAAKPFTYDGFLEQREDLHGERAGAGQYLFRFYCELIRLRRRHHALAAPNIELVHVHDADRVLAFRRWKGPEQYLVLATLSERGWPDGYELAAPAIPAGSWREIFTSDDPAYGGDGLSNGATIGLCDGKLRVRLPARGFVVLRHLPQG
jgi:1,4-alpha-glucan branching enzyme